MSLADEVAALLARQRTAWPLLAKGLGGLARARTRPLDGTPLLLRHIPHRVASTTAKVDATAVAQRPCFLCPRNLDPAEEGLPWGDFTLYANPFPIVERHLTVVHREHRPQRIAGRLGTMLDLAAALPGSFVLYNGPRCGASAPDHLHLQAASRAGLPIVPFAERSAGPVLGGWPARGFVFRGPDRAARAERALGVLAEVARQEPEPWVNVAAWDETLVLFPRGKHRPDAFHSGELTVSPATVDLCGVLVAPYEKDFGSLTGAEAAAVFAEVSLPEEPFRAAAERLA